MKKIISAFFFIVCTFQSFAQGEANIWYFGENAGLDFNTGSVVAINNSQLNTREGCSSFSTSSGELLFYSDGSTIWNKNHTPMPNGIGLAGDASSSQSAMIIPKPTSNNIYFIFTVGSSVGTASPGFNYYTIDMNAHGGLGDVIAGPIDLTQGRSNQWTEKVAAIKGDECNTYWVVSYVESDFYAYKVSSSGVDVLPVKTNVSFNASDRRGYLKISPNGKKLAIAHMSHFGGNSSSAGSLFLYDFNNATGKVTNQKKLTLNSEADRPYGVEFSSNSEKLYVNASNDFNSNDQVENNNPNNHHSILYQFDLSSNILSNINTSKTIIDSRNLYRGALQLGPDQKIYRTLSNSYNNGTPFLGVIENPENEGVACNYKHSFINLGGNNSTQGLPPFIASIFDQIEITNINDNGEKIILNNQTINLCDGDNFKVTLESLLGNTTYNWFKNDATTPFSNIANLPFPIISTADGGKYTLKVSQTDKCGITSNLEGSFSIKVHNVPISKQPTSIQKCDNDLDGFLTFNLNDLKGNEILNGQNPTEFEVSYFTNQNDADNNDISKAITNLYTNLAPFSKDNIVARIHNINNPKCYETKSFTVEVYETPNPPDIISVLGKCDSNFTGIDSDGLEIFDLTEREIEILNGQSASDFSIKYYTNSSLNTEITSVTAFPNTSRIQPIYVKITNKHFSNCTVITNFNIEVYELPTITSTVSLKQCDDDNDGFSFFNLNEANSKISSNFENETFTFYSSSVGADTKNSSLEILEPSSYLNKTINTETVWTRVETSNGCHRISEINLIVSTTLIPDTFQKIYYECDDFFDINNDERDGITSFNFNSVTKEIENYFPKGQQLFIKYYRNEADALSEINPIKDPSNYRNIGYPHFQTIFIRVDSQLDNDCLGLGAHITLHVEPVPYANEIQLERQCDDDFDGLFLFDTSTIQSTVLNGQSGMIVNYFDEGGNNLPSPLPNPFLSASQIVTIRVTDSNSIDPDGSCFSETNINFIVDKKPIANIIPDIIECDDNFDGIFSFDTSQTESLILNGQTGMLVSYIDQNGNTLPSPLPNPFNTGTKNITVKVENELNNTCIAETMFKFIVQSKPEFELDESAIYCLNLPPIIVSTFNPSGDYSYEWKDNKGNIVSSKPFAEISSDGDYTVTATSEEGCVSNPKIITIEASSIATLSINDITIIDDSDNNSITISTNNLGIGDYEFALQKENEFMGFYQEEPYFEALSPGIYTVFIRDKNYCGITQLNVSVIGFPKFFTPNNDGSNDTWKVLGINEFFYSTSNIYIFDRFGKLITQINPKGEGWNGAFNGRNLPSTDYWFSVKLIDNLGNIRIRKGHFSLIR